LISDEAVKTIELTTPIEDSTDVELAGDATEAVSFTIPGDEVVNDVQSLSEFIIQTAS